MLFLRYLWKVFLNQWHYVLTNQDGNIGKMLTPPKSKSPWEAATSGSTGGAFSFAGPSEVTNPDDPAGWGWVGPALTAITGAVDPTGISSALLGATGSMGGGTGFQGTDKGFGGNILPTLMGAGGGYLAGGAGKGLLSGAQAMMSPTATIGAAGQPGWMSVLGAGGGPATGLEAFTGGLGQGMGSYFSPVTSALGKVFGGGGGGAGGGMTGLFGGGTQGAGATGGWGDMFKGLGLGGDIGSKLLMAGGAAGSLMGKPPEYEMQTAEERYSQALETVAGKYLGEAGLELPKRAQEEYLNIINTPFGELYSQWDIADYRTSELEDKIGRSYDEAEKRMDEYFAQVGGTGSTGRGGHMEAKNELQRMRAEELRTGVNQIKHQNFQEAVKIKTDALAKAAEAGKFEKEIAMDLAKQINLDQQLEMAIQNQDYDTYQTLMSQVMEWGYSSMQPKTTVNIGT